MATGDDQYLKPLWNLGHLLRGKWIPDVLVALSDGPCQYRNLLRIIRSTTIKDDWEKDGRRNIQDRILLHTLRRMAKTGLVERNDESEFPFRVFYRLTPAAVELLPAMGPLISWTARHQDLLVQAQRRSREGEADRDDKSPD